MKKLRSGNFQPTSQRAIPITAAEVSIWYNEAGIIDPLRRQAGAKGEDSQVRNGEE
ncbi:MAG TPA: hypothetical protein VHO48_14830 [Anaerolineaceae bacterium]|nr:hypothetical protein [Anaerolineaceae bacterium]